MIKTNIEGLRDPFVVRDGGTYYIYGTGVAGGWDNRYGGRTDKAVTVIGGGNTLKFTGEINDAFNYSSAFRFEGAATVVDLTFDLSEVAGSGSWLRAISAASDLTVDNCTFIGSDNYTKDNAVNFGDTNATAQINATVSITNCTFTNLRRGISDNENAKEVKSIVVSGNTFNNAEVYISAYSDVDFNNNEVEGGCVNIISYTNAANVKVSALDNVLDSTKDNVIGSASKLVDSANVKAQDGFVVSAIQ